MTVTKGGPPAHVPPVHHALGLTPTGEQRDRVQSTRQRLRCQRQGIVAGRPGQNGGARLRVLAVQPGLDRVEDRRRFLILIDANGLVRADRKCRVPCRRLANLHVIEVEHGHPTFDGERTQHR